MGTAVTGTKTRELLGDWKRRLIDLTRRNRLLYFRPTRTSSLRIAEPEAREVFRRLVLEERSWRFYLPPKEDAEEEPEEEVVGEEAEQGGPAAASSQRGLLLPAESEQESEGAAERAQSELLLANRDRDVIESALKTLYRRSRTEFEERGVRVLHAAFGMLTWREQPQSDEILSPLLLVPCELKRESARDPFELAVADEDIVLNPALDARLLHDFRLVLPTPRDDWERPEQLVEYLQAVRTAVAEREWLVKEECWLALFSFHKLVIYRDLDTHAEKVVAHPLIEALAKDRELLAGDALPDPKTLDALVHPRDSYLVLDADSSQLAAIEAVKRGAHVVVQGPPGTGKSQTITNLVAEELANGKSVLFVSEKMAALEVVYKRLLNAKLGHYCLQLHSHNANKREVVNELFKTYRHGLVPRQQMNDEELERLWQRRDRLNAYVRALHQPREPLDRSAHDVLGELAELEDAPTLLATRIDAEQLTVQTLEAARDCTRRLGDVWKIAREGDDFPWSGCRAAAFGPETKARYTALLAEVERALGALRTSTVQLATALGLAPPSSVANSEALFKTVEFLERTPSVERHWLERDETRELREATEHIVRLVRSAHELEAVLQQRYDLSAMRAVAIRSADLADAWERTVRLLDRKERLDVDERAALTAWSSQFQRDIGEWMQQAQRLAGLLDVPAPRSVDGLMRFLAFANVIRHARARPDRTWFDPGRLDEIEASLPRFEPDVKRRNEMRQALLAKYDEAFFGLDTERLADEWAERFTNWTRLLKPDYYRGRRLLRRHRRDDAPLREPLRDLKAASELRHHEREVAEEFERLGSLFGAWFDGFSTDFASIREALSLARRVLSLIPHPTARLIDLCSRGAIKPAELDEIADRLAASFNAWERTTQAISSLLPVNSVPPTRRPLRELSLEEASVWAKELQDALENLQALIATLLRAQVGSTERAVGEYLEELRKLDELHSIEDETRQHERSFAEIIGPRFRGLSTDADELERAVKFAEELRRGTTLTPEVINAAALGKVPSKAAAASVYASYVKALTALDELFEQGGKVRGKPLRDVPFSEVESGVGTLSARLDEVRDWIEYRDVTLRFHELGLGSLLLTLLHQDLAAQDVQRASRRALLAAWVEWLYASEPALRQFRGENHEALVAEFRALDRKHHELGAARVIKRLEEMRPKDLVQRPGGEVAVLLREAAKKRRHLPIRKLFSQIPNLLRALKPCLLMSPLSVSQFLDPELNRFDLVIFDEASQIPTEDAVGAVYRGNQLVVAGDDRQLPPTAFFAETQWLEDEDEEKAQHAFDVFESVLDECRAVGVPIQWLEWHYRSKHESLIAFSNRRFYEDRLITFPAAHHAHPHLGIEFVHVPDAVYDRGGNRDNQREAERVVELVIEHFRKTPYRSLGVVAFSLPQRNTIENRLEWFRRQQPEVEQYFTEDRLEGFFVKNLETVQGDERDVIIFSVGYGRDRHGEFKMWFGPLNYEGGERRLNVAVTRAREKVIVVSSVRAADFNLGGVTAAGVFALHRYLDYAERGLDALESPLYQFEGEAESPLERSVVSAIRSLGYDVAQQVGCSKYRVDIGVIDPEQPGRFLLGVECDGAMYHSAYTARDRDRIRQEVLEKLGWRIHRVWSPDWTTRRETEIRRLKEAIERARHDIGSRGTPLVVQLKRRDEPKKKPPKLNELSVEVRTQPQEDSPHPSSTPAWAVPYRPLVPRAGGVWSKVRAVVKGEGPIHVEVAIRRVALAEGWQRAAKAIRNAVNAAIRDLVRRGEIRKRGDFLWPADTEFTLKIRHPADEDDRRPPEHIAPEELELALVNLTRDALSLSEEDLLSQAARLFGFERRGANVRTTLEQALETGLRSGRLRRIGERIAPAAQPLPESARGALQELVREPPADRPPDEGSERAPAHPSDGTEDEDPLRLRALILELVPAQESIDRWELIERVAVRAQIGRRRARKQVNRIVAEEVRQGRLATDAEWKRVWRRDARS